jgi:hypothetical protein
MQDEIQTRLGHSYGNTDICSDNVFFAAVNSHKKNALIMDGRCCGEECTQSQQCGQKLVTNGSVGIVLGAFPPVWV